MKPATVFLLALLLFGCAHTSGDEPTPADVLMAARTYAAAQSDAHGDDTHWCEAGEDPEKLAAAGAVVALPEGRYRVTGCVVGTWHGHRSARRFEAIVKRERIQIDVRELPILEFRWL